MNRVYHTQSQRFDGRLRYGGERHSSNKQKHKMYANVKTVCDINRCTGWSEFQKSVFIRQTANYHTTFIVRKWSRFI